MSQRMGTSGPGAGGGGLMQGLKRVMGGGGLFLTHARQGDTQAVEAGAVGGIIGTIMRGQ